MFIKLTQDNKGIALPIVLIVMAVLMVFGLAFTYITIAENRFAVHEEKLIQANYLARAGVDDVAAEIIELEAMPTDIAVGDVQDLGGGKSYIVNEISQITDPGYVGYFVSVTGRNNGVNSTLGLTITRDKPSDLLDVAIYSFDNLDITLMKVLGDVASSKGITYKSGNGSDAYDTTLYSATENKKLEFSYQQLPINDPRPGLSYESLANRSREINSDFIISQSYKYENINLNSGTLTFDTGVSEDGVLEVAIDSLSMKPNTVIKVIGDGLLKLYVMDDMDCNGSFDINDSPATKADLELMVYKTATATFQTPIQLNPNSDANRARIYLDQGSTLTLNANGNFNAYIIGPEATIVMQANDTTVNGAIIGNVVDGIGTKPLGVVKYQKPDDSWDLTDPAFSKRFYE